MTDAALLDAGTETVRPEWIDYNGHMNVAYYVLAFDQALDRIFDRFELGASYVKSANASFFVLETHVNYIGEVKLGDPMRFTFQLLDHDAKRVHYFMQMFHGTEGYLAATSEQLTVHVDMGTRRSAPMPERALAQMAALRDAQAHLARPPQAGRVIGIRRESKPVGA
jgi:acyl-CoA thioester hydrolase